MTWVFWPASRSSCVWNVAGKFMRGRSPTLSHSGASDITKVPGAFRGGHSTVPSPPHSSSRVHSSLQVWCRSTAFKTAITSTVQLCAGWTSAPPFLHSMVEIISWPTCLPLLQQFGPSQCRNPWTRLWLSQASLRWLQKMVGQWTRPKKSMRASPGIKGCLFKRTD